MDEDERLFRPLFWMIVVSVIATVFYTVIYSRVWPPPMQRPWGIGVVGSLMCNVGSWYVEEEEGSRIASCSLCLFGLVANIVLALGAFGLLLGPQSGLYHAIFDTHQG
jgi:hypothetical protein